MSWTFDSVAASLGLRADREQVLGIEPAEHQPHQLQADGDHVGAANQPPLGRTAQPAAREGEEDVQEDRERDQVERLADV